jgi:hypothetical protein
MRETISNLDAIEKELVTRVYLAGKDVALPKDEGLSFRDGFIYDKDGEMVGGITTIQTGLITRLLDKISSRILISPGVKGLTENGHSLARTIINHEIIHAYHDKLQHSGKITKEENKQYTEAVAYAYNIAYYKQYGLTSQLDNARKYTGNLSGRPSIMSWRHIINLTTFF